MKIGIVDMGGGYRGVYAAGILDYCMAQNIRFDLGIGVSAGSCNLISYAAGQPGRNLKFYTEYGLRKESAGARNFFHKNTFLDLDYLYSTLKQFGWGISAGLSGLFPQLHGILCSGSGCPDC